MADINNELLLKAYSLIDTLNKLVESGNATIFKLADAKNELEKVLKELPVNEVRELKKIYQDNNKEVVVAFNDIVKLNKERIEKEQQYLNDVKDLEEKLSAYNEYLENANDDTKRFLEDKIKQTQKELQDKKEMHQAEIDDRKSQQEVKKQVEEEINRQNEEAAKKRKEEAEKEIEAAKKRRETIIDFVAKSASKIISELTRRLDTAVNKITSTYEQNAGKLSAVLDTTVNDIGDLQRKIATELRDTSLSKAISNVAVMAEVASLSDAGFTNTEKIQANATAIAEARKVSPNLNLDNTTIKNLTNVFGSDFITRFSAIQAAVQDTAGSTAFLSQNLSKMMDDLEPVYLNAEYQYSATQATADVQATLSAAIENNVISESQAQEYLSMITELMDPSKAFKSSSTAVRVAATNYDFGSGDASQALQAILNARSQMYSNIDMSNSYMGNVSRALAASVYGDNTMSATYKQSGLYGLEMLNTEDLSTVWDEQEGKLKAGNFTTRSENIANIMENGTIAQGVSKIAQQSPIIYSILSGAILTSINTLPTRLAAVLKGSETFTKGGSIGSVIKNVGSDFTTKSLIGLGAKGSRLASLTSGATLGAVGLGIAGTLSTAGQWDKNKDFWTNVGHQGDTLSAILSNAGTGAGVGAVVGSFFGPMGNLLGAGVGALVGGVTGWIAAANANKEAQEANTKAIEAQTKATTDLLGEGVSAIDTLEAKREIARGGGIVSLNSGNYAIDYVKSSYAGFATGLDYVPYDDYVVRVHKGEAIVTADAARKLREKDPNFWNTPMNDDYDIIGALKEQTDSIVSAVNGEKKYSPLTKAGPQQYTIKNQFA